MHLGQGGIQSGTGKRALISLADRSELTELTELTDWSCGLCGSEVDTTQRLKATLLRPAGGNGGNVALAEAKAERTAGDLGNLPKVRLGNFCWQLLAVLNLR